jgi:hypothetical protein
VKQIKNQCFLEKSKQKYDKAKRLLWLALNQFGPLKSRRCENDSHCKNLLTLVFHLEDHHFQWWCINTSVYNSPNFSTNLHPSPSLNSLYLNFIYAMPYQSNNHPPFLRFNRRWNEKYVCNNIRSIRSQVIYFFTDMNVKYSFFSIPTKSSAIYKMMKKISSFFKPPLIANTLSTQRWLTKYLSMLI